MSVSVPLPDERPCDGRSPETVTVAAQRAVGRWLRKTRRLAAECAGDSENSAEEIHRLRVAIRHVDAALMTFRDLLPGKKRRRLRKRLRRLRRKAGKIRDVDVLLERVAALGDADSPASSGAGDELRTQRRTLDLELQAAAKKELKQHLKRRMRELVDRIRWREPDDEPQLSVVACALLQPAVKRCLAAGAGELTEIARLHQFRVCVKRLRYATEFLQGGLDSAGCLRLQAQLSDVQQRLGQVCDHAAAVRLLEAQRELLRSAALAAKLDELIGRERVALASRQEEFVAWWTQEGQAQLERSISGCVR